MEFLTAFDPLLTAGASLVAILGAVFAVYRWGWDVLGKVLHRITRFKPAVPRETLRAVPSSDSWWHMGSRNGQPAMQIVTRWYLTNIADRPVIVASARLSRGWFRREQNGHTLMGDPLSPGATREVDIDFWVSPAFRKNGESFNARLILTDQLGNEHRTQKVTVPSYWRPKREDPKPVEESIHGIADPRLKQVVAILKDEVIRYQECGRSVGGLGSVQVTYEGRTLNGIGNQWRESNSPRRQWIVPDPEAANMHSDNLEAMMTLFEKADNAGKETITNALVERIESGSEYSCIGYFFLFSLFRMGHLSEALRTLKEKLVDDDKYGFSDAVRLLSGLLQYEHPRFDDAALDEVERFVDGLKGHLFGLKEKSIAARAAQHGGN